MSTKEDSNLISESPQQGHRVEEVVDAPEIVSSGADMKGITPNLPVGFNRELEALIQSITVDPEAEIMEPPTAISIDNVPICTLGNFSLVIGRAKSHKTFLVSAIAAAAASGSCAIECITGSMPPSSEVHYFDTEQSTYHLHQTVNRIVAQTGGYNFQAYEMRPLSPSQRMRVIEYSIEHMTNPGFIIIDGLRDLLTRGINDEAEATEVMSSLLKWTHNRNSHIMLVLHQNKNDSNARGHVGTEAVNKAETVLKLTKKAAGTTASAEFCRNVGFEQFSFIINSEGLPVIIKGNSSASEFIKIAALKETFASIISDGKAMTYNDLKKKLMEVGKFKEATAKRRIKDAVEAKIIHKDEQRHYNLNKDIQETEKEQ